jgi:hypothetical protein
VPTDFFASSAFYSVAGASSIVFVISNTLQTAFNFNPRWLALVLSEFIAVFGMYLSKSAQTPSDYVIALLNGCLIYCTTNGVNSIGNATAKSGRAKGFVGADTGQKRRQFFTPWY